jgi:phage protein D
VGSDIIFKGEVCGLEPNYRATGESTCVVRAFNRLHRLLRGRKSKTFVEMSDQDIASAIAGDAGLSAQCGSEHRITHKHVYQHNQTNLEFLRLRAARIGYDVWVDGTDLHFNKAQTDRNSGIKLTHGAQADGGSGEAIALISFSPRMSSANVVKKVIVRGWDPEKKEEIVGEASVASSSLGSKTGESASSAFGTVETFEVDHPIFSVEEARAIAESRLGELSMNFITGEAWIPGKATIKAGIVIEIEINRDSANDRFNGKYLVSGATHTYSHAKGGGGSGGGGGFKTQVRVARDAESSGSGAAFPTEEECAPGTPNVRPRTWRWGACTTRSSRRTRTRRRASPASRCASRGCPVVIRIRVIGRACLRP